MKNNISYKLKKNYIQKYLSDWYLEKYRQFVVSVVSVNIRVSVSVSVEILVSVQLYDFHSSRFITIICVVTLQWNSLGYGAKYRTIFIKRKKTNVCENSVMPKLKTKCHK